jgi:histidyl-tRNA synthetase
VKNERLSAVKGMQDLLPPEILLWQKVEETAREVFMVYGYQEIRLPVMETTAVFTRSIGETSDIVEKEMYTFQDKAQRSVTLRPEGTAPIVRCYVDKNLHNMTAPQKFYYYGPMFRYERPQKGRLRQFYQIGAEAFGEGGAKMDAEVISMLGVLLDRVGLEGLGFKINSIGCQKCRPGYREALIDFLSSRLDGLCADCKRRYNRNPLRILDCKARGCIELKKNAPLVSDHLCGECRTHFDELRETLDVLGVQYEVDLRMVRGLDYYTRTTFEVTSERLGAQDAVAAGGRYDKLVEEFGGRPTPAVGFAVGMERLISLIKDNDTSQLSPEVYIAAHGSDASKEALLLARSLRAHGFWVELAYAESSLRSQMKRADKCGASYALIIGEEELKSGTVGWKDMKDGSTGQVKRTTILDFIRERANKGHR